MTYVRTSDFLSHFAKIHARTARLVPLIPEDKLSWAPADGIFSFGDLVRHLAGIERYMFVEIACGGLNRYPGHSEALADGKEAVLTYYSDLHQEALTKLGTLSDEDLQGKCQTPAGASMTVWKWLRLMLEHDIHHRGQLYMMLSLIDVKTPPLFGLTSEEVLTLSNSDG